MKEKYELKKMTHTHIHKCFAIISSGVHQHGRWEMRGASSFALIWAKGLDPTQSSECFSVEGNRQRMQPGENCGFLSFPSFQFNL